MDFNKILKVATMPVVVLVVLGIISLAITMFIPSIGAIIALPAGLIGLLIYVWAGYTAAKAKMGLVDAGIVGAAVALFTSIIIGVINLIIGMVIAGPSTPALIITLGMLAINIVFGTIVGFVLGIIGGLIGQKF